MQHGVTPGCQQIQAESQEQLQKGAGTLAVWITVQTQEKTGVLNWEELFESKCVTGGVVVGWGVCSARRELCVCVTVQLGRNRATPKQI